MPPKTCCVYVLIFIKTVPVGHFKAKVLCQPEAFWNFNGKRKARIWIQDKLSCSPFFLNSPHYSLASSSLASSSWSIWSLATLMPRSPRAMAQQPQMQVQQHMIQIIRGMNAYNNISHIIIFTLISYPFDNQNNKCSEHGSAGTVVVFLRVALILVIMWGPVGPGTKH